MIGARCAVAVVVAGILTASCSKKSDVSREPEAGTAEVEDESQPEVDQIAEDCVAFVRATKVLPEAQTVSSDCPTCPAEGADVFTFRHMKIDKISCSEETCTVMATIRAEFNPGSGKTIAGGLTGWIPPEQRSAYLNGQTPSGEQTYQVRITYKRREDQWRAVEFDRPDADKPVPTASTSAFKSGIEGSIVVSPTRPGPIRKDAEANAAPAPVPGTQFAVKAGDAVVATFTTDSEGQFRIALPPGHYVISRQGAGARIGRWQFEADVVDDQMTKVKWTADSGMR
jgi:hypothetical protein